MEEPCRFKNAWQMKLEHDFKYQKLGGHWLGLDAEGQANFQVNTLGGITWNFPTSFLQVWCLRTIFGDQTSQIIRNSQQMSVIKNMFPPFYPHFFPLIFSCQNPQEHFPKNFPNWLRLSQNFPFIFEHFPNMFPHFSNTFPNIFPHSSQHFRNVFQHFFHLFSHFPTFPNIFPQFFSHVSPRSAPWVVWGAEPAATAAERSRRDASGGRSLGQGGAKHWDHGFVMGQRWYFDVFWMEKIWWEKRNWTEGFDIININ